MRVAVLPAVSLAIALSVAGCATRAPERSPPAVPDSPTGPTVPEPDGDAAAAPASAVVGWMSSPERTERRRRALPGLGIEPLKPGAVGAWVDGQERELRERLRGTPVAVTRLGDNVTLTLPGPLAFDTGSATLKPAAVPALDAIATVLKARDRSLVEVAGHTDDTGAESTNQALSERRAGAVAAHLQARGVVAQRILTIGVGESRPIAKNDTPDGRRLNRRIEITLAPAVAP